MANKKTLNEVIDKLIRNPLLIDTTYKYRNDIDLTGFILRKPKFIKHDKKGVESASLLLYQINNTHGIVKINCYGCMCFVKELVEQLKKQDKVIFVATVSKLMYSSKLHGDYAQILEMKTLYEFDIDMASEWGS